MKFSVDYEKLKDLGVFIVNKSEEIDDIYSEILELCAQIDENWKSEDSSIYVGNMRDFVTVTRQENENLLVSGEVLKKLSSLYSEQDNKWVRDIMKKEQEIDE